MDIHIEVTSGTHRTTKLTLIIENEYVGELQIERTNFTKFCDLLFQDRYTVTGKTKNHVIPQ